MTQPENDDPPIEINRPNILLQKAGGSLSPTLAEMAERSLEQLSDEFESNMVELVALLDAAHQAPGDSTTLPAQKEELFKAALEVKSMGTTFGYALATRVAHSLCRLLTHCKNEQAPATLITAHIQTIRVIVRDGVKDETNPISLALADELEQQTQKLIVQSEGL